MKKPILAIALAAMILFGASFGLNGIAAKNAQDTHLRLLQTVLPDAKEFTLEPYSGEDANIRSVHKSDIGFVVEASTYGYAGNITMLIGVNNAGKVTGLVVTEAHETWGLGSKALTDHVFLAQFLNKSGTFAVATHGDEADAFSSATGEDTAAADGESIEVDALTGATVTTKAVIRCVNSAVAYVTGADTSSSATSWGG
ncbi:MAG: FMN-binding protein [Oscillospiraceae bacterium]|nr:FMN-binding protein [Oscillospiraceae bacterium]